MRRDRCGIGCWGCGVVVILLAMAACGTDAGRHEVEVRFDPPALAREAVRVEVALVTDCAAQERGEPARDPIARVEARRGEATSPLGAVEPGHYGLHARALSRSCRVVAAGCDEVEVVRGGGTLVVVADALDGNACTAGERCVDGACIAPDGGIDGNCVREPVEADFTVDPGDGASLDGPFMDAVRRASSGDTIKVASGTYPVDSISNEGKALRIVGGDVVLEVSSGGTAVRLSGDDWTFDGFGFDYQNHENPPNILLSGAGWTFANTVFWNTRLPESSTAGRGSVLNPNVSSGGTGTIRNCYLHDGAVAPDGYADYKVMWAGGDNIAGKLVIDGMWCEHWAENTLYLSNNSGTIEVRNSYFHNTNVSGPRVTDPALIEHSTFVLDGKPPRQYRNGKEGGRSVRGVWWNAEKGYFGGDVTIRNCDFVWKDAGSSWANSPIEASDGRGGALRVEGCRFLNETGAETIRTEGHELVTEGNTFDSADPAPPIPPPPPYGTTPCF